MNTHDKCRLPINSAVTGGKKYVDDEVCLTGVAAVAIEMADVVTMDAMVAMVAVAKDGPGPVMVSNTLCPAVHILGT